MEIFEIMKRSIAICVYLNIAYVATFGTLAVAGDNRIDDFYKRENLCVKGNQNECLDGIQFVSVFDLYIPLPGRFEMKHTNELRQDFVSSSLPIELLAVSFDQVAIGRITDQIDPTSTLNDSYQKTKKTISGVSLEIYSKKTRTEYGVIYSYMVSNKMEFLLYTGGNPYFIESILSNVK